MNEIVGLIGGLLAIMGVVVAVTRYLMVQNHDRKIDLLVQQHERKLHDEQLKLQDEQRKAQLTEEERRRIADELERSTLECNKLRTEIGTAGKAAAALLALKLDLDDELRELMRVQKARRGSIYAPVGSGPEVNGLVFVSIEPIDPNTQRLSKTIIPLKSMAGQCFTLGKSFVVEDTDKQKVHFKEAERISAYHPKTTLNIALEHQGRKVGVLQLLREEGEAGFTMQDLKQVTHPCERIAAKLSKLISSPDFATVLNLADKPEDSLGSVIIFDLTRSSRLFDNFPGSMALTLMNDYFEKLCDAAFEAGAVLDNYMGDGALLRFNIERKQSCHEMAAVKAALAMSHAFDDLQRTQWHDLNLDNLYYRAGVASGPLLRGTLGHSQFQRLTIIGSPISVAAKLCNAAQRDRSVILASEETYEGVKDQVIATRREQDLVNQTMGFTNAVYEITGIRS